MVGLIEGIWLNWKKKGTRLCEMEISLHWRHNEGDGVSNHQPNDCLLNHLFRRRSKKTSKLRVTGLCEGNSPVTGEFPAQRASYRENVSIWWCHHVMIWYQYVISITITVLKQHAHWLLHTLCRPHSRQVTEQLPPSGGFHSPQLVYILGGGCITKLHSIRSVTWRELGLWTFGTCIRHPPI